MTIHQVSRAENLVWRKIGDDIVVIKDDGRSTYILNKTSAFIWERCDGGTSIDEIASQLCDHFDVSLAEAKVDIRRIVAELSRAGIMNQFEESGS
jgi:hypothetical protein